MNRKKLRRAGWAIGLAAVLTVTGALSGCGSREETRLEQKYRAAPEHKVIIDSDAGADDAAALILAAGSEQLDILGVTVLAGNVDLEQGARNVLAALEQAGSDAPVYKGAAENYNGERIKTFSVFGSDGMGDAGLIDPKRSAEEQDAVAFILETVRRYPGEVELVALGPATNIARAIEEDPDAMRQVKRIWSMGTSGLGPGNASPVAEFNVYSDPAAYRVMLDSGIDITIAGFDMCGGESAWTSETFERLEKTNDTGRFVAQSFGKLREFYAAQRGTVASGGATNVCDPLVLMCMLHPEFVNKTVRCHGSCLTDPGETFGQVIFYQEGYTYDAFFDTDFDYNVTLVTDVNRSDYSALYLAAIRSFIPDKID